MHRVNTSMTWESVYLNNTECWQSTKLSLLLMEFSKLFFFYNYFFYNLFWNYTKYNNFINLYILNNNDNTKVFKRQGSLLAPVYIKQKSKFWYLDIYLVNLKSTYTAYLTVLPLVQYQWKYAQRFFTYQSQASVLKVKTASSSPKWSFF